MQTNRGPLNTSLTAKPCTLLCFDPKELLRTNQPFWMDIIFSFCSSNNGLGFRTLWTLFLEKCTYLGAFKI